MSTTSTDTFALLERRLARVEFQLGVNPPKSTSRQSNGVTTATEPVTAHLTRLEGRLKELCAKSPQATSVLRLYERNAEVSDLLDKQLDDAPPTPRDSQTAHVLSAASLFPQAVSDLSSLEGQEVPDARQLAGLVSLQPRIARALAVQRIHSEQQNELQLRSAKLLSRWYERLIIGEGEQWAAWEDRLSQLEMHLRRKENAKRREDEGQ